MGTISNSDEGNDVGVLDSWLRGGPRNAFLSGDDLVYDLQRSGTATDNFRSQWLQVNLQDRDLRPLIGNQSAPTVRATNIGSNPVFINITEWIAYGGCLVFNTFDAVEPAGTGQMIAEFLDPSCAAGQYTFSAATLSSNPPA